MKIFSKITTCLLVALALGATVMSCKKDVESVDVTPAQLTLTLKDGEAPPTGQLTASVTPEKAEYTLEWSSSNPLVAVVDNNGKVTAIGEGTATITAKAGEKTGTCAVTVKKYVDPTPPIPDGITVTFGSETWTAVGIEALTNGTAISILATSQSSVDAYPQVFPLVQIGLRNSAVSSGTAVLIPTNAYVDYYERMALYDNNDNVYGDWWSMEGNTYYGTGSPVVNITDYSDGKISGNFTLTMFDAYEKLSTTGSGELILRDLTVTFQNVEVSNVKKGALLNNTRNKNVPLRAVKR